MQPIRLRLMLLAWGSCDLATTAKVERSSDPSTGTLSKMCACRSAKAETQSHPQGGKRATISFFQARYPAAFKCSPSQENDGERAPPSARTWLRSKHWTLGCVHRPESELFSSLTLP